MEIMKQRKKRRNENQDWSSLPLEIVELICKGLTITDQLHIGSVCKPWLFCTTNKFNIWVPETPWLIENSDRSSQFLFFNNTYQKVYRIYKPFRSLHGSSIVGSFRGWLFIRNKAKIFILNPLSRIQVELPLITSIGFFPPKPFDSIGMPIPIAFAISTCHKFNPITIIMVTFTGDLAWCNVGDKSWKSYRSEHSRYGNIIFYNHKIYAITQDGSNVDIFKPNNESLVLLNSTAHSTNPNIDTKLIRVYLVECGGKVFVVKRFLSEIMSLTTTFVILEVVQESCNTPKLVHANSLEDHILFVADNSIESVHSKHCPRLKNNCIYYTDYSINFRTGVGLWEFSVTARTMTKMPFSGTQFLCPCWVLPRFAFECDSNCKCNYSKWTKRKKRRAKSLRLKANNVV
ncbi:hypothetical protein TanjilG_12120 [Lupinus angustifolius]|uniref:KIB1-4 beta-propeller domain-containing protein n=2 Tax=Lupinus angustifolius TaxID=3871 RepID=A0A1J7GDQ1_LUPAN|nr:hypothetical protein TanjilG_12120 [Lupinus angustifolius]